MWNILTEKNYYEKLNGCNKNTSKQNVNSVFSNLFVTGVSAMPVSQTGRQLPNPREISLRLFPDKQLIDPVWNLNAQQWGQIITHDMSLTAGVAQTRM